MAYVLDKDDLELEQYCYRCTSRNQDKCSYCNGTGYITTEFGEKVLEFIKRRGFVQQLGTVQSKDAK